MPATIFDNNHPFLPHKDLLSYEEIARLVRVFAGLGTRKVRITGGEPLIRRELPRLIEQLAETDGVDDIALTTNGVLLPQLAAPLRQAGLNRITVSLDALNDEIFQQINDRGISVQRVLDGIAAAEQAGFTALKINMVVQRGVNEDQVVPMAEHFMGTGHILRFIEFMDVGNTNGWQMDRVVSAREILSSLRERYKVGPADRHHASDVARRYTTADGTTEFGIISSVTQPFCGACSRARISSKGELFTCLFANHGTDLRRLLRSGATDSEVREAVRGVWSQRIDQYSEQRTAETAQHPKVEMSYIGG